MTSPAKNQITQSPIPITPKMSIVGKVGAGFLLAMILVAVLVPKELKPKFVPPGSSLVPLEFSLRDKSSGFIDRKQSSSGENIPAIRETYWQGKGAVEVSWEWNTTLTLDKDWLIGSVKGVFRGIAEAPTVDQYQLLVLNVFCNLQDSYGKDNLSRCARILMPTSELKKVNYGNILNKQLSDLIRNQGDFLSENQAMSRIWETY